MPLTRLLQQVLALLLQACSQQVLKPGLMVRPWLGLSRVAC
jgi:hypothetical protein